MGEVVVSAEEPEGPDRVGLDAFVRLAHRSGFSTAHDRRDQHVEDEGWVRTREIPDEFLQAPPDREEPGLEGILAALGTERVGAIEDLSEELSRPRGLGLGQAVGGVPEALGLLLVGAAREQPASDFEEPALGLEPGEFEDPPGPELPGLPRP